MSDRSVTVHLRADVSQYVAGMEQARIATGDLAKTTEASATQNKKNWDLAGKGMLITGGIIAAGVVMAVKAYEDFDHTMSVVKANIDDKSVPSMQRLADAAMEAGKVTEFSATAAAEAEVQLSKVGVTSAQITGGALVGVLALAAATEIDLPTAASIAAAAMNQFGLAAGQIPHVADLLASAANHALGGVVPLAEALKFSGVVASQFGISIDTTVGVLTMFAQAGITGTMAGTGFRMMLVQMVKPTDDAVAVMKKYNITTFDAQGNFVGMATLAGELHTKLGGLTQQEREHALVVLFGTRALADANILYAQGAEGVKKWTDVVNQQGFAEMQASTKLNNLAGDMQIFGTSVNVALIKEGSAGNGVLRDMAQFATGAVNAFGDLPAPIQATGLKLAATGAVVLILGGAFVSLTPKVLTTWAALEKVSVAGVSGTTALKGLTTAAVVAGVAIVGLSAANAGLDSLFGRTVPGANEAARALLEFATTGKATGDSAKLINTGFGDLGDTINNLLNSGMGHKMNAFGQAISPDSWFAESLTSSSQAIDFFKTLDTGLASMVSSGHGEQAAALFKRVSDEALKQKYTMAQLADALPGYSAAVTGAGKAASTAALSVDDLARSNAKSAEAVVTLGGQAGATGSAMRILGADADAASVAVKDLAKVIQTDMDAAAKVFAADTNVLGSYDPAKQVAAVVAAQDALAKARKAGSGVADAQNALDQAKRDQANASLGASYATQIKAASKFATDIAAVTAKGLDPNVIAKLLQEGPAKAEPALQAMLGGNSAKMIKMVNDSEKSLAAINARVIESARLTSMAVNSQNDQMTKDFAHAMAIDNAIATSGGKATVESLAAQLHIGVADVKRIAAEFGIGIADGVAGAVKPVKATVQSLQDKIDSIKQGKVPSLAANPKAAQLAIEQLQAQIDAIKGKTIDVKIAWSNSAYSVSGINPATGLPVGFATGGPIDGVGTGTSDSNLFRGSKGEHVLTAADVTAAGGHDAIFAYRKSLHGFKEGGAIVLNLPSTSSIGAGMNAATSAGVKGIDLSKIPAPISGGGGGVAQWAPVILMALKMLGQGPEWLSTVESRMQRESGGNPRAINLWDSNAMAGHPSMGLMQTIPGTFAAYAGALAGRGIYDPLANTYAGLNYAIHRYGSLIALMKPGGYANGTNNAAPGYATVGENGPEVVGKNGPETVRFGGGETVVPNSQLGARYAPTINVAAPVVHVYIDGQEFKGLVQVELAAKAKAQVVSSRKMAGV